jgi:medium-chain acyl-[acyl-carrier-protein] hydrolase
VDKIFVGTYRVHTYECDYAGRVHSAALLNYLQDTAGGHAARQGYSVHDLFRSGKTWVLSRLHVRISRYPSLGDEVKVTTWPSGSRGLFALRDYEASDSAGPVLVGTSSWMIIEVATRRPVPVADLLPADYGLERRALADDFPSIPPLGAAARETGFRANLRDIDWNRHVNNAVYVSWGLEAAPPDVLETKRPADVEISYRAEAFYGDEILSRVGPDDRAGAESAFLHQIVRPADGVELARLRTRWA